MGSNPAQEAPLRLDPRSEGGGLAPGVPKRHQGRQLEQPQPQQQQPQDESAEPPPHQLPLQGEEKGQREALADVAGEGEGALEGSARAAKRLKNSQQQGQVQQGQQEVVVAAAQRGSSYMLRDVMDLT